MKNSNLSFVLAFALLSISLASCEAIAGIFKAGMGFGIFLVVAVILLIVGLIVRVLKK